MTTAPCTKVCNYHLCTLC